MSENKVEQEEEEYQVSFDKEYRYWDNWRVLIWLPNLVGYVRVGLLLMAWHSAVTEPLMFLIFYASSYLLDMLDGFLARACGQTSDFGAQLDMIVDRISSAILMLILMRLTVVKCEDSERVLWVMFLGIMFMLDFVSHWFAVNSNYAAGYTTHKASQEDEDLILRIYYNKIVLAFTVGMAEFFFLYIYTTFFKEVFGDWHEYEYLTYVFYLSIAVGVVFKSATNVVQLINSIYRLSDVVTAEQEFDEAYANGEIDSYGEEIEEESAEEEEEKIGSPSKSSRKER